MAAASALFTALSAAVLFLGWRAIRAGRRDLHRRCMLTAVGLSACFLVCYLTRIALVGPKRFEVHGIWRTIYLAILGTHTLLAFTVPPLVIATVWFALSGRFDRHRKIVRFTLPIWSYVSVTGVVVYAMLYHWPR